MRGETPQCLTCLEQSILLCESNRDAIFVVLKLLISIARSSILFDGSTIQISQNASCFILLVDILPGLFWRRSPSCFVDTAILIFSRSQDSAFPHVSLLPCFCLDKGVSRLAEQPFRSPLSFVSRVRLRSAHVFLSGCPYAHSSAISLSSSRLSPEVSS